MSGFTMTVNIPVYRKGNVRRRGRRAAIYKLNAPQYVSLAISTKPPDGEKMPRGAAF
jgi:hypothetical protein